jgi:hypothetical protein
MISRRPPEKLTVEIPHSFRNRNKIKNHHKIEKNKLWGFKERDS